jgi:peptide deformylase
MEIPTRILNIADKNDEKTLRRKTAPFDFNKYDKKDIAELIVAMRRLMYEANGQGLAGNQIGLDMSVFVAKVDGKFYAIFNPEITDRSAEKTAWDGEGCLSVPGRFEPTYSPSKLTLEGFDRNGKKIKIRAWGMLALTFQHEVDHLNGKIFMDRMRKA